MPLLEFEPQMQQSCREAGLCLFLYHQLMRVLQRRFGEIPQQVQTRLETQSIEQLENLMDTAIAVSSLDEFLQSFL
ncbi:MAG TPA: DUF4351 domain-containing protein [Coleofasciculaceae cyanobacterium]